MWTALAKIYLTCAQQLSSQINIPSCGRIPCVHIAVGKAREG